MLFVNLYIPRQQLETGQEEKIIMATMILLAAGCWLVLFLAHVWCFFSGVASSCLRSNNEMRRVALVKR